MHNCSLSSRFCKDMSGYCSELVAILTIIFFIIFCLTSMPAGFGSGNKPDLSVVCPKCKRYFCLDCDIYIHESLHNCPGCDSFRHSKAVVANEEWRTLLLWKFLLDYNLLSRPLGDIFFSPALFFYFIFYHFSFSHSLPNHYHFLFSLRKLKSRISKYKIQDFGWWFGWSWLWMFS